MVLSKSEVVEPTQESRGRRPAESRGFFRLKWHLRQVGHRPDECLQHGFIDLRGHQPGRMCLGHPLAIADREPCPVLFVLPRKASLPRYSVMDGLQESLHS
ncbi:hypothetical protein PtA15_1A1015 [Puccinia triticina]|uniref:Uncharacterized protein n=1 Tax=Puccinia triticina TaxID=208348 RepID=A0ABY7CBB5_9BASI|nr:uncharacterized protein PtA15_1A1015 [Puccinia triticina]WAQ81673.1 hypothetical protein PtA15_1A1015 [Puccinia triticina]WAR52561.1 hypothetical protein PtB15_1B1004 [Puccinia triticina]